MTERFHDWQEVYKNNSVENMGWYWPELDEDLRNALLKRNLTTGTFLDIGTGPGTQANQLANHGFTVTATDIAEEAIKKAQHNFSNVSFIHDDILNSKLTEKYNFIFDRGCFHTIHPSKREIYIVTVNNLLNKNGILFLKCFSNKETDNGFGPYRFTKRMLIHLFKATFTIEIIKDTVYQGTRNPQPRAIFSAFRKM